MIEDYLKSHFKPGKLKPHPLPGILGGMGPESTIDLYQKIIRFSREKGAFVDQQHFQVLISVLPQTPDRTRHILGEGKNPMPYLLESAFRLKKGGADFLVIACNTAYFYRRELEQKCGLPILDLVSTSLQFIQNKFPHSRKIGLLATDGTYASDIFRASGDSFHFKIVYPNLALREHCIMPAIYGAEGIKRIGVNPGAISLLKQACESIKQEGVDTILCACTEISMVSSSLEKILPVVDTSSVVAQKVCAILTYFWKGGS